MKQNFKYLADLFPSSHAVTCPKCSARSYVFGIPSDEPTREILACSACGYLFNYPCPSCKQDTALPHEKNAHGYSYQCQACGHRYHKPPGWLERPADYQEKLLHYFEKKRSQEERAADALR